LADGNQFELKGPSKGVDPANQSGFDGDQIAHFADEYHIRRTICVTVLHSARSWTLHRNGSGFESSFDRSSHTVSVGRRITCRFRRRHLADVQLLI
jgi:hypothetical protein